MPSEDDNRSLMTVADESTDKQVEHQGKRFLCADLHLVILVLHPNGLWILKPKARCCLCAKAGDRVAV